MKRLQNRIAESGAILQVAAIYNLIVWLIAGLAEHNCWPQLACLAASCYLLIEISNSNALIRIRSRMVTTTFIFLSAMFVSGFASMSGAIVQLCFVVAVLLLFSTYQENQSVGRVFYAFMSIGLSSLFYVHILYIVPIIWILMATQLQSLSGRTLAASVIGLIAPYWFFSLWFIYQQDFTPFLQHFASLGDIGRDGLLNYSAVTLEQMLVFGFVSVLSVAGMIHFWSKSFEDKIRIRLLYGFFTALTLAVLALIGLMPQHFNVMIRIVFVCASPIIAHFMTLTSTRITNIAFFVVLALCVTITVVNLWML